MWDELDVEQFFDNLDRPVQPAVRTDVPVEGMWATVQAAILDGTVHYVGETVFPRDVFAAVGEAVKKCGAHKPVDKTWVCTDGTWHNLDLSIGVVTTFLYYDGVKAMELPTSEGVYGVD